MIRLGLRLAGRGGREATARLVFTALGVAVGVALLCFTLGGFNGLKAKDSREGWYTTSTENRQPSLDEAASDPLWWRMRTDLYDGDEILRVDVAATGPRSPLPPGVSRALAAGEYYVSPALARLLAKTPDAELSDRLPGRQAGIIADSALSSPESLVVIVGRTAADMRALSGAVAVRSIETAPREHDYTTFLQIVLGLGAIGLLLPVMVFVATSTRLAAARREERFAAFRLVGATRRQVNVLASVESALAAVVGTTAGFALFYLFRPLVARIPFTGESFFTTDVSLGRTVILLIGIGVPLAAVGVSLWSLRRVHISPLGVSRQVTPRPPRAWRLIPISVSLALLAAARVIEFSGGMTGVFYIVAAFAGIIAGIVIAGPWLTFVGARCLSRLARGDATLIAGRRLSDDPGRAFRAISGVVIAVFVGTVFAAVVGTAITNQDVFNPSALEADTMAVDLATDDQGLAPAQAETLAAEIGDIDGVDALVPVRVTADASGDQSPEGRLLASDWRRLGTTVSVAGKTAVVRTPVADLLDGAADIAVKSDHEVTTTALAGLPVRLLLVTTDGRQGTIERVRTVVETQVPGAAAPLTVREIDEYGMSMITMLQRLVDVGIFLSLVIAGCSLAVSVAGGLIERKRPFSLLRLTGMPLSHLRRIVLLEALVPLALATLVSIAAGLFASDFILRAAPTAVGVDMPGLEYWIIVVGGLAASLAVVIATLPLLDRTTQLQTARME